MATVKKPKKQFDWDAFRRGKIAVHLKTEKEAEQFSEILHEKGFSWRMSGSCLNYPHCGSHKGILTFYGDDKHLIYGTIKQANRAGDEICMFSAYDFS